MVNLKGFLLRQEASDKGTPLPLSISSYTEGLHGLIQQAANNGDITSFALCRRGPKLTHLFFANDSLLFYRAIPSECNKVMDLLFKYETVSGQKVNRDKTALFFSGSVDEE